MSRHGIDAIAIERGALARLVDGPVPRMSPPGASGAVHVEGCLYPYDYACIIHELMRAASERVPVVVMHVDSPGGYVGGIYEVRRAIAAAQRAGVYVVAYVSGMCASAALWVASAADEVVVSPTAQVGSVGVVVTLYRCGDDECVEVVSTQTPAKRLDIDDEAALAQVQARVDALAAGMLADISRDRGVTVEALGAGAVYGAAEAVTRGVVDRIATDADDWMFMGGQPPIDYARRPRTVTLAASLTTGQEALDMSEQAAAQAAQTEALAREVERLRGESAAATARAEAAERQVRTRDAEALIDGAIRDTRIAQAARAAWVERAVRLGVEEVSGMLADLAPMAQVGQAVGHGSASEPTPPKTPREQEIARANDMLAQVRAQAGGGVR